MKQVKSAAQRKLGWLKGFTSFLLALMVFLGLMPGMEKSARAAWNETYLLERDYVVRSWDGSKVVTTHNRDPHIFTRLEDRTEKFAPTGRRDRFSLYSGSAFPTREYIWYIADKDQTFTERCDVMGDVHLIINDGVTITCQDGIRLPAGSTLHIHPQKEGTGKLIALGDTNYVAAIGGDHGEGGGNVVIHGCNITADSYNDNWGSEGAGIGGGNWGSGGEVTIYAGTVYARGSSCGAGIGSGDADGEGVHGGKVTIYGGNVTAIGGSEAAGIGGGEGGSGATVRVYGGTVNATGGETVYSDYRERETSGLSQGGAGIGSGDKDGRNANAGSFVITNGTVRAQGGPDGAGIGGGNKVSGGTVDVRGGKVIAIGGHRAAGIGGGNQGSGGTFTITGGRVEAFGTRGNDYVNEDDFGDGGAGIGGGRYGSGGTITISGGSLSVVGGMSSAGIGGGYAGSSGKITISGGELYSRGAPIDFRFDAVGGAGIGSGYDCSNSSASDTVTITGGRIEAFGGMGAAGIGCGAYSPMNDGGIFISGGLITQARGGGNFAYDTYDEGGAGIGGGYKTSGGNITITGGRINAYGGGNYTAGIGGGYDGSGGIIKISDCEVNAYGSEYGAGIGGGEYGDGGRITITNARVFVKSGYGGAAGIGGGYKGSGGDVTISQSHVTSEGRISNGDGGANNGRITLDDSVYIRVGTSASDLKPIARSEYINAHDQWYVKIEPYCRVTYDANGATGGEVPVDTREYQPNTSFEVKGNTGKLVKTLHKFTGWNTAADGSGKAYAPETQYSIAETMTLYAQWEAVIVPYLDWNGSQLVEKTGPDPYIEYELLTAETTTLENGKWYVVMPGTLNNGNHLEVKGTAHLILTDGATLNAQRGFAVNSGSHLILHGQKDMTGTLTAQGSSGNAGIGGYPNGSGGVVTVNGCNVTATGGNNAAGIGGGVSGNGGEVTVNGGTVQANGGSDAAGIGGGRWGNGGKLTVNGGTVWATGRYDGAGVGGGINGSGGEVTVNGGTLWATGGSGKTKAKGIGAGNGSKSGNDGALFVATSHVAYSSASTIDDGNKASAAQQQGKGSGAMTLSRTRYMLVEKGTAVHVHDFTYSAESETITATCTNKNTNCTLDNREVTLKIVAPERTTYGVTETSEAATLTGLDAFNAATGKAVTATDIRYVGIAPTKYDESATAPTNAGSYTAMITVEKVTASVDYQINKAEPTANPPEGLTAIYGQTLADVLLTNPKGNTPGTWSWVASPETKVGSVGNQTIEARFTPVDTVNYNDKSGVDVTVTVGKAPNPATVSNVAYVQQNGNNVDLSKNVKDAKGAVSYEIQKPNLGCRIGANGVLTSGSTTGAVKVNVTAAGDDNYEALVPTPITVTITENPKQTIIAHDVTTTFGATDAKVEAQVSNPETGGGAISYAVKEGSGEYIAVEADGMLTIKAVPPEDGKAYVTVKAAETQTYAETTKDVTVTIKKAKNPARVSSLVSVLVNGHTVDLKDPPYFISGGATGTVTYAFRDEETHGCKLNGSELTSGNEWGQVWLNATVAEDSNYLALPETPIQVYVNPKPVHKIEAEDVTFTYGKENAEVKATVDDMDAQICVLSYAVKDDGSGEHIEVNKSTGHLTLKKAGEATVVVTAPETDHYFEHSKEVTVTIDKAPNPASVTPEAAVTMGGNTVDLAEYVKKHGAQGKVDYEISGDNLGCILNADGVLTSGGESGEVAVNVTVEEDDNYLASETKTITVTITEKQTQTIFAKDVTATYGDTGRKIEATLTEPTTGGGEISYAVKPESRRYIDVDATSGALTIRNAGTATVVVTAAETETFAKATREVTVTIAKARPKVTVPTGLTATYGQTLADVALPMTEEGETEGRWEWADGSTSVGEAGTHTFKAIFTPRDTANYLSLSENVAVTVKKEESPVFVIPVATVRAGGNTVDLSENVSRPSDAMGAVTYKIVGDDLGCSMNDKGVLTSGSRSGVILVSVSIAADARYEALLDQPVTVYILKVDVNVTAPTPKNPTYTGASQALVNAGSTDFGTLQYALGTDGTTVPADSDYSTAIPTATEVGIYYVWYRVVGGAGHNDYGPYPVVASILREKAAPETPSGESLVYSGEEQALVKAGTAEGGTLLYALSADGQIAPTEGWGEAIPTGKDAGTYYVWYMVKGDKNHNDTQPAVVEAKIARRPLLVSPANKSKTYGEADPELTWTQEGLVDGDALAVTLERAGGENVGGYAVTVHKVKATDNYEVVVNEAVFTIKARRVTVTARDQTIIKGGEIKTGVKRAKLSGQVKGHALSKVKLTAKGGKITASGAKIADASGADVTGNYKITYVAGKLTVEPKPTAKPTKTPKPTAKPTKTPKPTAKPTKTPKPSAQPTKTPKPTKRPKPTATPTAKPTAKPTATPKPTANPDFTLLARMTVSGDSKTALKIAWTEVKGADGYDIFFAKCGKDFKLKKTVTASETRVVRFRGLDKRENYKGYVRAWKKEAGQKIYIGKASPQVHAISGGYTSRECNTRSVKLNKSSLTLRVGRSKILKATVKGVKSGKKLVQHVRKVRFYSTNANVATVTSGGKVKAVGKGSCTIYALANNGVRDSVKVKVK